MPRDQRKRIEKLEAKGSKPPRNMTDDEARALLERFKSEDLEEYARTGMITVDDSLEANRRAFLIQRCAEDYGLPVSVFVREAQ